MTISNYLTPITGNIADTTLNKFNDKVYKLFSSYVSSFRNMSFLVDLERENAIRSTEISTSKQLTEINRIYRKDFLNVSPDYKRENLTVWSFAKKSLVDIIGERFNFNFNKRNYKERTKITATPQKLHEAFIIALAFLFSKYEKVYKFHLYATLVKVAIDFFEYESLMTCDILGEYVRILDVDIEEILNKITELNLKTLPKQKKKRERKDHLDFPTKEEFEAWINSGKYSRTEIKEAIARQYNVSQKTIQRLLAEYGLTRKCVRF